MSPSSDNWTSSVTASPILPPPPPSSSWDFWDPFVPRSSCSATEEEWEEVTTTVSEVTAAPAVVPPPSVLSGYSKESTSELAMVVVPRGKKDLSEIVKELDEYFLKATEAGSRVSFILEAPNSDFSSNQGLSGDSYGKNLNPLSWSWRFNSKTNGGFTRFGSCRGEMVRSFGSGIGAGIGNVSHTSTVEKLHAWEKKLLLEVKNAEMIREEHEKRVALLRKQEVRGVDYIKMEKNKMEIERLESKMMQLKYLNCALNSHPTSDIHRQAALQLELEVENWYSAFCSLVDSQREYIHALTGWLRLSLFQCHHDSLAQSRQNPEIYSLCEEWQLALDRIPDKVASEGIKSFLTVIHAVVMQQAEEQKQKKRSEVAFRELEKRAEELRSLESKFGPYLTTEGHGGMARRYPVLEKRAKVEALKAKAEEEKSKYEKSVGVTRAMTLNNLQTGFPNVFQAMTGFAGVCMQVFESVYNHQRSMDRVLDTKRLLPRGH
ncbi:hypothetical protein GW17_00028167 [Ensete ventricosum]|nr:hypothetical protein GW17_00028167 [Ensete ventricosum]